MDPSVPLSGALLERSARMPIGADERKLIGGSA
jgi:hypothetical protein